MDDRMFPQITYRQGASSIPSPVLRGTGIWVQTIVVANRKLQMPVEEIADNYDLSINQVRESLALFEVHREEIEGYIDHEDRLTKEMNDG